MTMQFLFQFHANKHNELLMKAISHHKTEECEGNRTIASRNSLLFRNHQLFVSPFI